MNELILATVEHLRSSLGLSLSADMCDEQPDGQPPPMAGQVYYAVHEGSWTNADDENLDEYCGVNVTITLKAGTTPKDRTGLNLLRDLRKRRAEVRAAIHNNYDLMNAANTKIGAAHNGFVEPLRFRNAGTPEAKGPDWFYAEGTGQDSSGRWVSGRAVSGVAVTLTFERARRVQKTDEMG